MWIPSSNHRLLQSEGLSFLKKRGDLFRWSTSCKQLARIIIIRRRPLPTLLSCPPRMDHPWDTSRKENLFLRLPNAVPPLVYENLDSRLASNHVLRNAPWRAATTVSNDPRASAVNRLLPLSNLIWNPMKSDTFSSPRKFMLKKDGQITFTKKRKRCHVWHDPRHSLQDFTPCEVQPSLHFTTPHPYGLQPTNLTSLHSMHVIIMDDPWCLHDWVIPLIHVSAYLHKQHNTSHRFHITHTHTTGASNFHHSQLIPFYQRLSCIHRLKQISLGLPELTTTTTNNLYIILIL